MPDTRHTLPTDPADPRAAGRACFGRLFWLPAVVAVGGVALSVTAWRLFSAREMALIGGEFRLDAEEQVRSIERQLESDFEAVYALAAFFETSPSVDRHVFKAFVTPELEHHASIQALEWLPRVRAEQRDAHEEATRSEGFDGYEITETAGDGRLVRAGDREEYFPVHFVEPLELNRAAFGFDVSSEPTRRAASGSARDNGRLTITGPVRLVQETEGQCGLLAFLPVFQKGAPADTATERRRNLLGYVCCVLRVGDLVEHALIYPRQRSIVFHVVDESTPGKPLLCGSPEEPGNSGFALESTRQATPPAGISHTAIVDVGGRRWSIVCTPAPGYLSHRKTWLPWFVLFVGLAVTGLLTAYVVSLSRQATKVQRLVTSRTAELHQANEALQNKARAHNRAEQRFRRLLESAPDAMVIVNREGGIVLANRQAERLFGRSAEELLGKPVEILLPERFRKSHLSRRTAFFEAPRGCCLESGEELGGLRKDGSEFPAEINLSPIETDAGTLVSAAIRDITARRRAEQEIEANLQIQQALASLLQISLEPIPLEKALRRSLELLLSLSWLALESKGAIFLVEDGSELLVMKAQIGLPQGLLPRCAEVPFGRCLCGRAAASGEIQFASGLDHRHETHYAGMTPHGHFCVPINFEGTLYGVINLYVKTGHPKRSREEAFLLSVADVIAGMIRRSRAEESLRASEERFDLAVRGTDAGIWDWDLRTNQVYFSPHWKSMLGYEEDEIANQFSEWESRLHPDDRETAFERLHDYLQGRSPSYELEHRLRHKDGSYRWILARGTAVRSRDGQPYRMVGSHLDVTERRQAQELQIRRETQLLAAQRIQERLLPVGPPKAPGLDVAGASRPAEFAGGDYFDYFAVPDGSLAVAVGDMSGHGFGSALVMAATHALIHLLVDKSPDVGEVLTEANAFLVRQTEEDRFVTMLLARIDPERRILTYANAGHPPGFILDGDGRVKCRLESTTFPLGIDPHTEYPAVGAIEIQPDDTVLLLTDGILEAMAADGSRFGVARALEVVRASLGRRSEEIVEDLHRAVREFSGKERLDDDVTCVVLKVEPPPLSGVSTGRSKAGRIR